METALDVLSRAATMVQDNANEARLTSKELPTSKWRRERRLRTAEYHVAALGAASSSTTSPPNSPPPTISAHTNISHANPGVSSVLPPSHTQMSIMMAAAAPSIRPLSESTNRPTPPPTSPTPTLHMNHLQHSMESPIDMSVTSTTMKRASPPPPYREPLPGSTYATSLARPSVITQAPPKRGGELCDNILISNRENDNRSTESISMCETVIDEHFRRSLGPDYVALFAKKASAPNSTTPSPQPTYLSNTTNSTPTPPPPPTNAPLPISYQPQPLISPKPTAILLAASAIVNQTRSEPITARTEKTQQHVTTTSNVSGHVSIQQQALPLQHSNTPQPNAPNSPQPINATRKVASPLNLHGSNELHSTTHSPAASPRHSPTVNVSTGKSNLNSVVVSSSTTPATVPAVMRIKTEPGFSTAGTTTPPASPTSSSSNNSFTTNSDILASVDDHFAKALGDTWKKLQENKEMRK